MRVPPGLLLAAIGLLGVLSTSPAGRTQALCEGEHDTFANACVLGVPDAQGVTLTGAITRAGQVRAYKFRAGPGPAATHLYLGDLWYDLDVSLYRDPPDEAEIGRWFVSRAATTGRRVLQFERPEVIVQALDPGLYTLFVAAGDERSFDPNRPFTLRLALGPPICATQGDDAGLYRLALSYQPTQPTPQSLLSFNAFLAPPYSDLFDFEWRLNGQPLSDVDRLTMQLAASELPPASGGSHRVSVTARGVREYPDPDPQFRHLPPTLSVDCTFPAP
jgi:hypothetical protein